MAVTVVIPGALRELAGNRQEVRLEGAAGPLSAALARLWAECPGIRDRVITERGVVRTHVNIFIDASQGDLRVRAGVVVVVAVLGHSASSR